MGREGAAAARELKREMKLQLMVLGGTLAVLWLVEIVDLVGFGGRLQAFGIQPRTLRGLPGTLLHPFLHSGLGHLVANSVGLVIAGWMVLATPSGTPAAVLQRVNREMDAILKDPDIVKRLREIGFFTEGAGTLQEAADFVRTQYEAWGKVVREIGLQPE